MPGYVSPKLRQIVAEAVFRREKLVLTTLGAVCSLALLGILLMHKKYEAHAKLLVQNVRTAAQLTTSSVDHLVSQGDVSQSEINTEVDLLESDEVARRALGQTAQTGTASVYQNRKLQRFKGQLTVQAVHQTDVIDLELLGSSPQEAKDNLEHVIDAYFEERAGTARNSGAADFFQAQLQEKTRQLNLDQAALTAFQMQHGIADLEDQTKLQVAKLSTLQDQTFQAQAALAAAQNKAATEQRELSETAARSQTQVRMITNQYSQERLNTSLVDLQNRRIELLKRYVPADRQIVEVDEKIVTTRKAINEAAAHPAAEEATDANPVWVHLSTLIATSGGEISALQGQQAALAAQIQVAQNRLREFEESAASYGDLRRKLQQSQTDYSLYAQRRDEARISEALDRQKLFDVAVIQAPMASSDPVRPKPVLYMICASAFGLLLAIAFAIYADLAGGFVYTPAQLDAWTGTRTWATFADETQAPAALEMNRRQYRRVLFALQRATAGMTSLADLGGQSSSAGVSRSTVSFATEQGMPSLGTCVAVTSALQGEGVTHTVNQLAAIASRQVSTRVAVLHPLALLEDLDLSEGKHLPMRLEHGAEHWVLSPEVTISGREHNSKKGERDYFSSRLRSALHQMRNEFDLVLLDCPSLQQSTLAGELAPWIDGYIAVVRAGTARRQNVEDLAAQLNSTSAPVLGHVLNCRDYPVPRWLHRII